MPHFPDIPEEHYDGGGFGALLKRLRQAHGWSLRAAAREAGVSHPHLLRLEAAKAAPGGRVSVATLWHLARAYGVPCTYLLEAMLPQLRSADDVVGRAEREPAFAAELARAVQASPAMRRRLGLERA